MAKIVYSSLSRELVVHPTLSGFKEWLASREFPQDSVGMKHEGRDPLTRFIESLNPGSWVTVEDDCYYVNHHWFEWEGGIGGCLAEHILELTRGKFISATETLEAIKKAEEITILEDSDYL